MASYSPTYYGMDQGHVAINPAEGVEEITADFALDPGRSVAGRVLDPDGRPLPESLIYGCGTLGRWDRLGSKTDYVVESLRKSREGDSSPATLVFRHEGRRLAAYRDVAVDEPGPIAVKLQPWAEVVGRVVRPTGKPPKMATLRPYVSGKIRRGNGIIEHKDIRDRLDAAGRFHIEGLAPGLAYKLQIDQGGQARWLEIGPIEPGQILDMGEIRVGME